MFAVNPFITTPRLSWPVLLSNELSLKFIGLVAVLLSVYVNYLNHNAIYQRSPNFLDDGPNSRSYQCPRAGVVVYWKKAKTTPIPLVTFVYSYLFSLLGNVFAMWLMKLLRLLHRPDICSIWFRCNTECSMKMCIWDSVSILGLIILHLRKELFAKISTSKQANNFWTRSEILLLGDNLCKIPEAFLIEILLSDRSNSAVQ